MLLALAFEDAAAFRVLISSGSVHPATALFHAQQAVEKAIKAVLVLHCVPFGRTHDLVELGYRAEEAVSGSPCAIERLARLNPYAVAFRYAEPSADLLEPEEAEEVVASVTEWAPASWQWRNARTAPGEAAPASAVRIPERPPKGSGPTPRRQRDAIGECRSRRQLADSGRNGRYSTVTPAKVTPRTDGPRASKSAVIDRRRSPFDCPASDVLIGKTCGARSPFVSGTGCARMHACPFPAPGDARVKG